MAAKGKGAVKSPVKPAAKKGATTAKGMQLSSAQWIAYTKAYTATSNRLYSQATLQKAARRFRQYRQQSAYATQAKLRAVNAQTSRAAIAAYATRQSYRQSIAGHQNAALRRRVYNDYYHHMNTILGRLQFSQAGEKKWTHRAVMRTVDMQQAISHQNALRAAAAKAAAAGTRAPRRRSYKTQLSKQQVNQIKAAANAAGLKAAQSTPSSPVQKRATATRATPKNNTRAARSKKAPGVQPKARGACAPLLSRNWLGNENEPNCVAVAIANHLRFHTGIKLTEEQTALLSRITGTNVAIPEAFRKLKDILQFGNLYLREFGVLRIDDPLTGAIVGYESEYGEHAALALSEELVASWGGITRRDGAVEEAWWAEWEVREQGSGQGW
jgi:hypothetical protein